MAEAHVGRGEMHAVFPPCSPSLSFHPSSPPFSFLLGFWVHTQHHTSPSPFILPPPFLLLVWLSQSYCSVCHCMIVILTTHSHGVLHPPLSLFPSSHSQHTSRLHLDARLDPHGEQGCRQQHLKRTLSQRSTPPLPPTPPPFLMSVRTRRCSCCALP